MLKLEENLDFKYENQNNDRQLSGCGSIAVLSPVQM